MTHAAHANTGSMLASMRCSPAAPGALLVRRSLPQRALARDALFGGAQAGVVPGGIHRGPEGRTDARNFHAQDIAGRKGRELSTGSRTAARGSRRQQALSVADYLMPLAAPRAW